MNSSSASKWRIKVVYFLFSVIVIVVIVFLFRWQILENDRYKSLAKQRIKDTQLSSLRGSILASDGSALAYSEPVYDVYVYIPDLEHEEEIYRQTRDEFLTKVSTILGYSEDELKAKIEVNALYIKLKQGVDVKTKESLQTIPTNKNPEKYIIGLQFEPSEKRIYPDGTLACHILGFLGKNSLGENVGRNGIEGYWNGDLEWKEGYLFEETDSFGNQIITGNYEPVYPKVGRNVRLTINRGLQEVVERKIKEGVEKWNAKSGTVIVMDPKTGAILAMANYPNYDPESYWESTDYGVYRNRAVSDPYEFGSVGKIFTASAAIDSEKAKPDTIILESHEGCVHVLEEKEICTASRQPVTKPMDITDVLAYSDNIGAFYTAELVGADGMYQYLRAFGMGRKTNVGLAEETTSLLKEGSRWNRADLAAYSYGQGYSGTPLQIISGVSAIPNNGTRMQPYIVSEIYDEDKTITITPKAIGQPVRKESAEIINSMLTEVFDRNGSKYQFKELRNYKLAGKSGTASVLSENGMYYAEDKVNVSFIGWDSSGNATFVMLLKLEEPEGAPFSVTSVQPLWMETFLEIKDIVGVEPIVK